LRRFGGDMALDYIAMERHAGPSPNLTQTGGMFDRMVAFVGKQCRLGPLHDLQLERGLQISVRRVLRQHRRAVLSLTPAPILGGSLAVTPAVNGVRAVVHLILFMVFFYFGYIRKRVAPSRARERAGCRRNTTRSRDAMRALRQPCEQPQPLNAPAKSVLLHCKSVGAEFRLDAEIYNLVL
jgi:hypothetical protein